MPRSALETLARITHGREAGVLVVVLLLFAPGIAAAQPDAVRLRPVSIVDQQGVGFEAYRMLVPVDWQVDGRSASIRLPWNPTSTIPPTVARCGSRTRPHAADEEGHGCGGKPSSRPFCPEDRGGTGPILPRWFNLTVFQNRCSILTLRRMADEGEVMAAARTRVSPRSFSIAPNIPDEMRAVARGGELMT